VSTRKSLRFAMRGRFGPLPSPERWGFVVGCCNSGTSLLHELLARHPDIGSLPAEGQFLTDQLPVPTYDGLGRAWALDAARYRLTDADGSSIDVAKLKRQWGACFNDVSRPVLIEKSPPNAARTRWLQARFMPAVFIGIVRNGYAVAEGISRRAGRSVSEGARQWARSNEIMLDDWASLDRKILVRYEDVVTDPELVLTRVFRLLSIDRDRYDSSSLRGSIPVHERSEPLIDMNNESVASLSDQDVADIETESGTMLARLGYVAQKRTING
jgi:hypothetical protein